jgi:23S rRNA (uracil1939-C5)-methyltransferase
MDFKKNNRYTINITDIGVDGEGIGKIDGFTFFVDKALPGETVEIIATKLKKNYGYGKLVNIIVPSKDRVEPICKVADKCGGCSIQHLSYSAQLSFKTSKVKQNLIRIGGFADIDVLPTLGMENPIRYRNKAQYPVSVINGELVCGFYANHSHRIVPCEDCLINDEQNSRIIAKIKAFMTDCSLSPYNEEKHSGFLRHIVIKNGVHTGEVMVCLVVNANSFKYKNELIASLSELDNIKSIVISFNTDKTNVILGKKIELVYGNDSITDTIGDLMFNISPLSFFQVNPKQTEVLYKTALDFAGLTGNETVIDAYCGIGTISLFLAKKAKMVYGVEIVPEAINAAKQNARLNNITNVQFYAGKSEEIVPLLHNEKNVSPDVMVVDPPRKGCEASLLKLMLDMKPHTIVYVSCDSATLARDLKLLCNDLYKIECVQPVDMFPHTTHVETVCLMSRIDK